MSVFNIMYYHIDGVEPYTSAHFQPDGCHCIGCIK